MKPRSSGWWAVEPQCPREGLRCETPAEEERSPEEEQPHGFTFELPNGWHLFSESQTPALSNPVEILSAGTVPPAGPDEGSCAHVPVGALERMGPRGAFVTVQERYGEPRFPGRPKHFTLPERSEGTDDETCARNGERLGIHWFATPAGRGAPRSGHRRAFRRR